MKTLSVSELLNLTGGKEEAWTECDVVIAMANGSEGWTEDDWKAWDKLFDEYCL